jgi:hypothetical protein
MLPVPVLESADVRPPSWDHDPACPVRTKGSTVGMADKDDLFTILRKHGLRKSLAQAIADAERVGKTGGAQVESLAREAIKDLGEASDAIRARVLDGGTRSTAAKKAADTRKRDAAKRSEAAKKAAATRKARATSKSG